MTRCPHCHGRGQLSDPNQRIDTTTRPQAKRMIPHGLATEAALRAGTLEVAPYLFCGTCPSTGKDRWELATETMRTRGEGTAMVLPEGANPAEFRFPALPVFALGASLVAFAYGLSLRQQHALGNLLIATGLDVVEVVGGNGDPLTFKAV